MKKTLLSLSALLVAVSSSAQTWTELPVVTNDYTSYSTAKIQVDPITQRPSVGFKGRKALATDTDFLKGLVYEYVGDQWKQIAVGSDNVNGSVFDYQISPLGSGVSHGYMAYYDDDSAKVKNYLVRVERIYRGAPTYQVNPEDKNARVWVNDTLGNLGNYIQLPAAASFLGFNVITDYRASKSVVSAVSNKTERSAVYDYATNSWTVDSVSPVKSIQTYKAVQTLGPDGSVYVMSMLRGGNYAITVSRLDSVWTDLEFPNAGSKNLATYPIFDLTTDKHGNLYTISVDDQSGNSEAYVRKYDAATKTWSYVGGESKSIIKATDTHIRLDMVAMDDSTLVVAYSDPTDTANPYAVRTLTCDLKTNTWGEPVIIPGTKASGSGDLSVAKTSLGELYVAYVDDDSKIRVMKRSVIDNSLFDGLTCDTLTAKSLGIPASMGSAKQITYKNDKLGITMHTASYSYNVLDKDTLGTTIFCDTIQAGFALSKASKARDGVNPGFVVTANQNHAIKAMRVYWYVIASNIGREMDLFTSDAPYTICSDIFKEATQGTKVATVAENAEGYTDITFEGDVHYFGFNTNSAGLFVRSIVLGYADHVLAIESVEAGKSFVEAPIFNLMGQRVEKANAGIYVQGNHKVVVR